MDEIALQREYYRRTSGDYDAAHLGEADEHAIALSAFCGLIKHFPHGSILDVGAGTGRGVTFLQAALPASHIIGVEPVAELRVEGYRKGVSKNVLLDGDALALPFADSEFDWVIETGTLHHIRDYRKATAEMCRVARHGVMISDSNNMGQGRWFARLLKQTIKSLGLWPALISAQTGGKIYKYSEGDGVYYSFCAFDCVEILQTKFPMVHFMNTARAAPSLYRTAGHVMIVARASS